MRASIGNAEDNLVYLINFRELLVTDLELWGRTEPSRTSFYFNYLNLARQVMKLR